MSDNEELHLVFGTGPVGLAVMDELVGKGKRVRMVNRSGRASVAEDVEVIQQRAKTLTQHLAFRALRLRSQRRAGVLLGGAQP